MTRNEFKAGAVQVCGVLLTTYYACLIANLINTAALWGRFLGVGASVATLYGIKSAYDHQKERQQWTDDQKRAASLQRMASGQAPIQGFEHLLVDPTLVLPSGSPAPSLPPSTPPPIKGA
jgi:hypothetical protein